MELESNNIAVLVHGKKVAQKVFDLVISATPDRPISNKTLVDELGLSRRTIQEVISNLRADYPICSQESGVNGYFLATKSSDMLPFLQATQRKSEGIQKTLDRGVNHYVKLLEIEGKNISDGGLEIGR